MPGTITLRPIEANISPRSSLINKSDPHYTLVLGKQHITSQECNEGIQHPHWSKASSLLLKSSIESTCVVELKDEDMLLSDESIGLIEVNLKEVEANGHMTKWYPISLDGQNAGEVLFEASFKHEDHLHGHNHNGNGKKSPKDELIVGSGLFGSLDPLRRALTPNKAPQIAKEEDESPQPQNDLFVDIGKYKSPMKEDKVDLREQKQDEVEDLPVEVEENTTEDEILLEQMLQEEVQETQVDKEEPVEDKETKEDESVEALDKEESDYVREEQEYLEEPEEIVEPKKRLYSRDYNLKKENMEVERHFSEEGFEDDEELIFTNGHPAFCKSTEILHMEDVPIIQEKSNVLVESELDNGLMGIQSPEVMLPVVDIGLAESEDLLHSMPPLINKDAQMLMDEADIEHNLSLVQNDEVGVVEETRKNPAKRSSLRVEQEVDEDYLDEVDERGIGAGRYKNTDETRCPSYKEIMGCGWDI